MNESSLSLFYRLGQAKKLQDLQKPTSKKLEHHTVLKYEHSYILVPGLPLWKCQQILLYI